MVTLRDTDDETAVREVFRKVLSSHAADAIRRATDLGHDDELWSRLIDLGAPAMALDGGAPLTVIAVVAEELGRALAPVALIEHQLANRMQKHTMSTGCFRYFSLILLQG